MPELAEVEAYRRVWNPLLGQRVDGVVLRNGSRVFRDVNEDTLRESLYEGLEKSRAFGKQMVFFTSDGVRIGIHLGMAGRMEVRPLRSPAGLHEQIAIVAGDVAYVFRDTRYFGKVRYAASGETVGWDRPQAPDLLSSRFRPSHLVDFFASRARSPVKALLLEQRRFPGVGNWMADEILWRARLAPECPAGRLRPEEIRRLYREIRFVCRGALAWIADRGEDPPSRSWLFRHRWKDGGTCPRCHTALRRIPINSRTACYCPNCQAPAVKWTPCHAG